MKRLISLFILSAVCISFFSCNKEISSEKILSEFSKAYGLEGIIYSSFKDPSEEGFIPEELVRQIYVYDGDLPKDYSIYLNSHSHKGSECAVFICENEDERQRVNEMCLERIKLVANRSEDALIIRSGKIIAYSTLEDREKAELLLKKIIAKSS